MYSIPKATNGSQENFVLTNKRVSMATSRSADVSNDNRVGEEMVVSKMLFGDHKYYHGNATRTRFAF